MKKKIILILGFGIDKDRYEAVSKNTIKHKKILEGLGHKVLIYNIGYKNPYFDTGNSFLSSIIRVNKIKSHLISFTKKHKVTHILDEFVLPLSSQIFTLPLRKELSNIKFIKEVHNDSGFSFKAHSETLIRIIANSEYSLKQILNGYDKLFTKNLFLSKKRKINYIPTDINIYKEPKTEINGKKINICYLGHPLEKKGIYEFLELFKIIPNELKKKLVFNFSFSSVGPREKVVAQFQEVANQNNIEINFYNEVKPNQFYRKNDIYILPIHDHFGAVSTPNTILEAMEAGCLVVTNKILSLEGMFENNEVVYLDNYRASNILEKLIKVLNDIESGERIIKKARKLIEKDHSIKNIKQLIQYIYEQKKR